MSHVPPSFDPRKGSIPGGVPDLSQPRAVPPTTHEINFHGCMAGFYVLLNEENKCRGYRLMIQDPREATIYYFDFDQVLFDEWKKNLNEFPDIGEMPEGVEEAGNNGAGG